MVLKNLKTTVLGIRRKASGMDKLHRSPVESYKSMISHKARPNDHSARDQNLIPCPSQCKAKDSAPEVD